MNAKQLTEHADELAENGMLKLAGRFMMLLSGPAAVWLGTTIWAMNAEQAKLRGAVDVLTVRIETQLADSYRGGDALRDFKVRDQKDAELDRRMDRIEVRVDRIENSINNKLR